MPAQYRKIPIPKLLSKLKLDDEDNPDDFHDKIPKSKTSPSILKYPENKNSEKWKKSLKMVTFAEPDSGLGEIIILSDDGKSGQNFGKSEAKIPYRNGDNQQNEEDQKSHENTHEAPAPQELQSNDLVEENIINGPLEPDVELSPDQLLLKALNILTNFEKAKQRQSQKMNSVSISNDGRFGQGLGNDNNSSSLPQTHFSYIFPHVLIFSELQFKELLHFMIKFDVKNGVMEELDNNGYIKSNFQSYAPILPTNYTIPPCPYPGPSWLKSAPYRQDTTYNLENLIEIRYANLTLHIHFKDYKQFMTLEYKKPRKKNMKNYGNIVSQYVDLYYPCPAQSSPNLEISKYLEEYYRAIEKVKDTPDRSKKLTEIINCEHLQKQHNKLNFQVIKNAAIGWLYKPNPGSSGPSFNISVIELVNSESAMTNLNLKDNEVLFVYHRGAIYVPEIEEIEKISVICDVIRLENGIFQAVNCFHNGHLISNFTKYL